MSGTSRYPEAIASLSQAIKLAPKEATFLDSRGDAYLKSGEITKAIVDYDAALKLFPKEAAAHQWRLGIALYYAERFLDGVKQFEIHKTVNPEDVENAVWHYLCLAKVAGAEKARDSFIAVNKDQRVPMREIHRLYAGQGTQAEVLKSAESQPADTRAGRSARFYAHLYISLWHESQNEPKLALEHMKQAVEKYQIGDYMYDVAKMHLQLRSKAKP